ncbi:uncharacterized protein PG986_002711 [Apiospora aurea]|uniref:Uncharacterized protein n=1 Tax=Apiospora aurea TaxID=335848 RepID=A0ABR1QR94_9PEZI
MGELQLIVPLLLLLAPYAKSERLPECDHKNTPGHKQQASSISICNVVNGVMTNDNIDQIQDDGDRKKTFVNKTVDQLLATYTDYNALVYSDEQSGSNTRNSVFQHRNGGHAEGHDFNLPLSEEGRSYRYHIWVFATGTFSPGGDHRVSGGRGDGEEWGYSGCIEQNHRGSDVEFCNRAAKQDRQSSSKMRTTARKTASSTKTDQPSTATTKQNTDDTLTAFPTTSGPFSTTTSALDPTTTGVQTSGSTNGGSRAMTRPSTVAVVACVLVLLALCF